MPLTFWMYCGVTFDWGLGPHSCSTPLPHQLEGHRETEGVLSASASPATLWDRYDV
jgi:hypothetical protein